jgi:MFS transporter, DHA1 family, multidrug resistance protein
MAQGSLRTFVKPPDNQALLRSLLPVLIIISMIGPLALNILMPSMPGLASALDASRSEVQLTLSLFLASQAVSQLFIGGLADRYGRRPVLLGSLALYVLACLAASFAASIQLLILARIVQAAGSTAGLALSRTIVRDLAPRDAAASMIGYVTMGMVIAPLLAPAVGGFIDDTFGWRMIFVFSLVIGIIALTLAYFRLVETRPGSISLQTTAEMLARSREVMQNRRFLGYALGSAFTSAAFFAFLGAAPYLVVEAMEMPKTAYGLWFVCLSGGYLIGNFCSGRFSEKLGGERMIFIGNVAGTLGMAVLLALALVPVMHPAAIFGPCVLMSFGNGVLLPNAVAGAVSVDPKAAGAASGMVGFLQMGIGAVMSFIAGQVTTTSPLPMAIIMFTLTCAAWGVMTWGVTPWGKRT